MAGVSPSSCPTQHLPEAGRSRKPLDVNSWNACSEDFLVGNKFNELQRVGEVGLILILPSQLNKADYPLVPFIFNQV